MSRFQDSNHLIETILDTQAVSSVRRHSNRKMIVTWIFLNAYGHDVAIVIVSCRKKGEQVRNCLLTLNWQLSPAFLVIIYNIFPWRLDDLIQGPEQRDILHQPVARHIPPVTGHTYPCSKITLAYTSDIGSMLSKELFRAKRFG
jgi:hypothetical protein